MLPKIAVLDDDPTGVQTVHDIYVYTDWETDTIRSAFAAPEQMFFIMTNSRSFSAEHTAGVHQLIAERLALVSKETGTPFILISRSDSTLRGHFPLETAVLRETLEKELPIRYGGEILIPFFPEGGRYTIGNIHYVKDGDRLIPAAETEFAKDTTFGYHSSDLREYCEEKTHGAYPASSVTCISIEELRARDIDGITAKLAAVHDFGKVIVNSETYDDLRVFAEAFLKSYESGKQFIFRGSAAIVKVLGNVTDQPLLGHKELCPGEASTLGGVIIIGSHVAKTTKQLESMMAACPSIDYQCFDASTAFEEGGLEKERDRILTILERNIPAGITTAVYTSRQVLRSADDSKEANLALSVSISNAITSLISCLRERPAFILSKGGITSSDVGVKALGVKKALVKGQAAPAVPVWETGAESRFPGIPYVIFPGNVGTVDTLGEVVKKLMG